MKLIRRTSEECSIERPAPPATGRAWKVLIVDDEPDVHTLTQLNLRSFNFAGRSLELLHAHSASQARELLLREHDIAVALIDVVMETDDAGLKLVEFIRQDCGNKMIRIIIRTGQPGVAPEREIINNYDIDDYKDKTELTAQKLYTSVRTALKAYHDLKVIDANRKGLDLILSVTPKLYLQQGEMAVFFSGVLTQVAALCSVEAGLIEASLNGFVATVDKSNSIHAGIGIFNDATGTARATELDRICAPAVKSGTTPAELPADSLLVPLAFHEQIIGYIYLEGFGGLTENDHHLIHVMANQVSAALLNQTLQSNLRQSNNHALHMLAVASEFKDIDTGQHISRIRKGTTMLALACGLDTETAARYGDASILHDLGKLGVPDAILQKPGKLSPDEYEQVKQHPGVGAGIMGNNPWFELARECAVSHHEHWDGNGYPRQLQGEQIPLIGRIVAVMDVFDALLNKRPYKEAWPLEQAVAEIERCSGSQFDPQVVSCFMGLYRSGQLNELV